MRENGPRIYTLAVRLSGNLADGQDLAQDTFVQAWRHWERFRGDSDVGTWLHRICVNRWKNRVRYEKRRSFWKHFSLNGFFHDDEESPRDVAGDDPPLDQTLDASERQAAVQRALSDLDPHDRSIVVLRDMEDRSYEEMAAILGLPLGTVKSRLARSRERLRQKLASSPALGPGRMA